MHPVTDPVIEPVPVHPANTFVIGDQVPFRNDSNTHTIKCLIGVGSSVAATISLEFLPDYVQM